MFAQSVTEGSSSSVTEETYGHLHKQEDRIFFSDRKDMKSKGAV